MNRTQDAAGDETETSTLRRQRGWALAGLALAATIAAALLSADFVHPSSDLTAVRAEIALEQRLLAENAQNLKANQEALRQTEESLEALRRAVAASRR